MWSGWCTRFRLVLSKQTCSLCCEERILFLIWYVGVKIHWNKISSNCCIFFIFSFLNLQKIISQVVLKTYWRNKVFIRTFGGIINVFFFQSSVLSHFRSFLVCFSIFESWVRFSYQLHWKFGLSFISNRSCSRMFLKGNILDWCTS